MLVPNGLSLDESTLRDGNCGLDACLRGFAFVDNPGREITNLLTSVTGQNRKRTINLMRQMLIKWLRAHKNQEILPHMTVEQFVVSDTGPYHFASMNEYLEHMAVNDQWIDHIMLYAISAVFEVQLLVFVGGQDSHHSNVYNAQRYAPTALHVTISVKGLIIHHGNSESLHGVFAPHTGDVRHGIFEFSPCQHQCEGINHLQSTSEGINHQCEGISTRSTSAHSRRGARQIKTTSSLDQRAR